MLTFESWNQPHGFELDFFGQGGREAVDVGFNGVPSFWFDEYLVSVLVCKPVDLVFYAGAVAGSFALMRTIEHGALVK